jgi:D-alanine-D-alanine ligase
MDLHYTLRTQPGPDDIARVQSLVSATGFFSKAEVIIAGELVEEALAEGEAAGYHFIFAEESGAVIGYCCFGPVPLTRDSFDLYWIAVAPGCQGSGLGHCLMAAAEDKITKLEGTRIYADTSSREQYLPTRKFYETSGYHQAAYLPDFYAPGDGKIIYCKLLMVP